MDEVVSDEVELAENISSDNSDLQELESQLSQATEALEKFGKVYSYLTSGKNVSIDYAKEELYTTFKMIGLQREASTIATEAYSEMPKEIAIESLIDTIKNGISRVLNAFVRLQDFIMGKLSLAFRNVRSFVAFTDSDINKTQTKIQLLDKTSRDFVPSKKIRRYLKTKNGQTLDYKATNEILQNHIDILNKLVTNKEILQSMRGEDLDTYRMLVTKAVRNSRLVDKKEIDNESEYLVGQLEKIYREFRSFYKKPLADGKTLLFEFDDKGAERFAQYEDIFKVSVVNNYSYIMPMDGKTLTRNEAEHIIDKARQLKDLYTSVSDYSEHFNDLRRKLNIINLTNLLGGLLVASGAPIANIVLLGVGVARFLNDLAYIVRYLGYTTSSLSYYAVRESCRYIRESAAV